MYMGVCMHVCMYMYVCMYACMHVCTHVCTHACMYPYVDVLHARVYTRTCLSVRVCIHVYM